MLNDKMFKLTVFTCLCLNLLVSVDPSSSLSISPSNLVMGNVKKVIIVGAGASGIAAASRLVEKGIKDVLILEAEDRIGGRIYTLDVPGDAGVLEIGAQWVHGEKGNVVYELASAKNLVAPSETLFGDMMFVQSSAQIVDADLSSKMWNIFQNIRTAADINVTEYKTSGNYFLEQINSAFQNGNYSLSEDLKSQFIELFHQFINSVDGSDSWFQSSASTLTEYWECEGNSAITWKQDGYRRLFSLLTEKADSILGKSLLDNYVKKNTEVVKVIPEGSKVRVRCDNGEEYVADHVIVTVSLGVLQANYQNLFPKYTLSDKQQKAIQNLLIGSVAKLYLKFPHKWWPDNTTDIGLLWNKTDKQEYEKQGLKWITDVFVFMVTEHHNTTLCGWVCGQSARDMEAFDEQLVKTQLMQVLRKFLGHKYNIPDPVWFHRSTWKLNPHFSGTYSLRGIAADLTNVSAIDISDPVLNKENVPVILFAGEATHPHFYSTVHGAVETGWREADRIVSLKKSTK